MLSGAEINLTLKYTSLVYVKIMFHLTQKNMCINLKLQRAFFYMLGVVIMTQQSFLQLLNDIA